MHSVVLWEQGYEPDLVERTHFIAVLIHSQLEALPPQSTESHLRAAMRTAKLSGM